jgi:PAS domain S-box-containing protein
MRWCYRRRARPLRLDAISKENVEVRAAINGAALAVVAVLSLMTWIFWDKRLGAAVVGSTGVVAVLGFVLVAELRWRAERIAGNAVRLYQLLADHSSDMIVSFDPSTQQRTYVSPSCRRLYGYEPEEAMAMAATEIIHPADLPAVEAALEKVGERGRGAVRYRGRRKDGNYIWVEASLTASRNPATGATEIVSVVRDVSDRVRFEVALRDAKQQADAANLAKSEFLNTISHELRTPLNAVIGFSEIMQSEILGPIGNDKYRSYIGDIQASGTLLLNVINDILHLSKAEVGKLELTEDTFDVEESIRAVLRLLQPRIESGGLCAEIHMPSDLPMLRADQRKTQQLFTNLLSNAVKFTQQGGRIDVVGRFDRETGVTIRFIDTGIGIEPEKLNVVFEPFRQIDSALSRKHNGTGLGLPIVKAIMEQHEGRVELKSTVGSGTEVSVIFPPERVIETRSLEPSNARQEMLFASSV